MTIPARTAPKRAADGPLASVRAGAITRLDVENCTLSMDVSDEELQTRSRSPISETAHAAPTRGCERLYVDHVMAADTDADLDFPVGASGEKVSRGSH